MVLELIDDFEHLKDGEPSRLLSGEDDKARLGVAAYVGQLDPEVINSGGERNIFFRGEMSYNNNYVRVLGGLAAQFRFDEGYVLVTQSADEKFGWRTPFGKRVVLTGDVRFYVLDTELKKVTHFSVYSRHVRWDIGKENADLDERSVCLICEIKRHTANDYAVKLATGPEYHLHLLVDGPKRVYWHARTVSEFPEKRREMFPLTSIRVYRRYRLRWPRLSDFLTWLFWF